jgi:hypothetical protein
MIPILIWIVGFLAAAIALGWVVRQFAEGLGLSNSLEYENLKAIEQRQAEIGFNAWEKEVQARRRAHGLSDR